MAWEAAKDAKLLKSALGAVFSPWDRYLASMKRSSLPCGRIIYINI